MREFVDIEAENSKIQHCIDYSERFKQLRSVHTLTKAPFTLVEGTFSLWPEEKGNQNHTFSVRFSTTYICH